MEGHVLTHIVGWVLEHLKHLLQDDQPVLEAGERLWSDDGDGWGFIVFYLPCMLGPMKLCFFLFSDSHVSVGGRPYMDGAHHYGE